MKNNFKPLFTSTEQYSHLSSFLDGLRIDYLYSYSTRCVDSVVSTFDDKEYFMRNVSMYS